MYIPNKRFFQIKAPTHDITNPNPALEESITAFVNSSFWAAFLSVISHIHFAPVT